MEKHTRGKVKGTSLMALVITMIVLLILSGITIATLSGDNGIINRSLNAKDSAAVKSEIRIVEVASNSARGKNKNGIIEEQKLKNELDISAGKDKTSVEKCFDGEYFLITFLDSKRVYRVDNEEGLRYLGSTTDELMSGVLNANPRRDKIPKRNRNIEISIRTIRDIETDDRIEMRYGWVKSRTEKPESLNPLEHLQFNTENEIEDRKVKYEVVNTNEIEEDGSWYLYVEATINDGELISDYFGDYVVGDPIEDENDIFMISYVLNGGTNNELNPSSYTSESEDITLLDAIRTGYTFTGWTGNGTTTPTKNLVLPKGSSGHKRFTANWNANTYTIIFNKNSNSATGEMADLEMTYGVEKNLTQNTFTRTGYEFGGWNTKADGTGTNYSDGQKVKNLATSGEVTLYAKWNQNARPSKPIITANYSEGNATYISGTWANKLVYTTITSTSTENSITTIQYSKDNKATWNNLSLGRSGGIKNTGSSYYGQENWTVTNGRNDTVYFRVIDSAGNISEESDAFNIKYDTASPVITANNITFGETLSIRLQDSLSGVVGWQVSSSSAEPSTGWTTITSTTDKTVTKSGLTAGKHYIWAKDEAGNVTSKEITVTYLVTYEKGTNVTAIGKTSEATTGTVTLPSITASNGYTVQGWYNGNTKVGNAASQYTVTGNITLTAKAIANTYTVSFNNNGGTGGQSSNVTATYNAAMPTISTTAPTKTGYTFMGWYDNSNYAASGAKQYYTAAGASARSYDKTSNTTLYAGWKVNQYTLTINPNGGTWNNKTTETTITQDYNTTYNVANNATKTGYIFGGWKLTSGNGDITYFTDGEIKKQYIINSTSSATPGVYNNKGNGAVTHNNIADSTSSTGYSMKIVTDGEASPGTGGFYNSNSSQAGVFYYHKIVAKVPTGYNLASASNSTGVGYGYYWITDNAGTGEWKTYIYAQYAGYNKPFSTFGHVYLSGSNNTSVTWYLQESSIYQKGTDLSTLQATNEVFKFTNSNATLTAQWSKSGENLVFDKQGGTFGDGTTGTKWTQTNKNFMYDTAYTTAKQVPHYTSSSDFSIYKNGYTFDGWYTASTGGTKIFDKDGMLIPSVSGYSDSNRKWLKYDETESITIYARWTPNVYKVTLNNQGATTPGTTEAWYQFDTTKNIGGVTAYYYSDSTCTTPLAGGYYITKPTKSGYTFKGYYTGENGTGTQYVSDEGEFINNIYKTVAEDTTLYAKWNVSALTFNGATLAEGTYGTAYTSGAFTAASGGSGNYKYEIIGGAPTGASIDGTNGANRKIKFTATTSAGRYNVVVKVTDTTTGAIAEAIFVVKINKQIVNPPTNVQVSTAGIVTWTASNNATGYEISMNASSGFTSATSGVNYLSSIIGSTGNKTVYVRAVNNDTANFVTPSTNATASVTVYSVTLTTGTGISSVTGEGKYISGATVSIDATVKTGYTWSKWIQTSGSTQISTTKSYSAVINSNWNYTADATINSYTISYTLNGGSVTGNPTSYTVESNDITLINPTKSGWTFTGWSGTGLTGNTNTTVKIAKGSTGNRTYTAHFSKEITLTQKHGSSTTTQNYTLTDSETSHEFTLVTSQDSYSGWTFRGWLDNATPKAPDYQPTGKITLSADKTVYATYSRDFTATFIDYNGTTKQTRTETATAYGNNGAGGVSNQYGSVTIPTQSTYTGWTAKGWTTKTGAAESKEKDSGASLTLSSNPTYYGLYEQSVSLTYNANGGSSTPAAQSGIRKTNSYAISTYSNPSFTLANAITKNGYSFDGWTVSAPISAVKEAGAVITPTSGTSLTATAAWTENDLVFNGATLAEGTYGTAYTSGAFTAASGGSGNYKYEIIGGAPTGASIDGTNGVNRKIKFTATTPAGTYNVKVKATDTTTGANAQAIFIVKINKQIVNPPTNVQVSIAGIVTWTASNNATGYEISMNASSGFDEAESGINYLDEITESSGSRTVYVRAVNSDTANYVTPSSNASKAVTVYNVTLTKGTGINTVTGAGNYISGATVTIDATVGTGYTWSKWTETSGGAQVSTTNEYSATINSDWAYTANTTANVYTITLDNQGATTAGSTAIYEKYGTGYYKESGCTNQMTTSANGITIPQRTGYTFGGYYLEKAATTQYIDTNGKLTSSASNTHFTSNGTLYAKWTKAVGDLTITLSATDYIYNGNSQKPTVTVKDGSTTLVQGNGKDVTVTFPSDTTNVGAKTITIAGNSVYNSTTKAFYINSTTKNYNIKNAKITFNATTNSGTLSGTSALYVKKGSTGIYTGVQNTTAGTVPTATRSGYTFTGWYTAASGGTKVISDTGVVQSSVSGWTDGSKNWQITADSTLYAQFSADSATITIKKDGNTWNDSGIKIDLSTSGTSNTATFTSTVSSGSTTTFDYTVSGTTYYIYAGKSDAEKTSMVNTGLTVEGGINKTQTVNYYTTTIKHFEHVLGDPGSTSNQFRNTYLLSSASESESKRIILSGVTVSLADFKINDKSGFTYEGNDTATSGQGYMGTLIAISDNDDNDENDEYIRPPSDAAVTTTTITSDQDSRMINLFYRRNKLYVRYSAEYSGGTASLTDNGLFTLENSIVKWIGTDTPASLNDDPTKHWVGVYGGTVNPIGDVDTYENAVSSGLADYNNPSYINITRNKYMAVSNVLAWSTGIGGTGAIFNESKGDYLANNFAEQSGADLSAGDVTITLYVNWVKANYSTKSSTNIVYYSDKLTKAVSYASTSGENTITANPLNNGEGITDESTSISIANKNITFNLNDTTVSCTIPIYVRSSSTLDITDKKGTGILKNTSDAGTTIIVEGGTIKTTKESTHYPTIVSSGAAIKLDGTTAKMQLNGGNFIGYLHSTIVVKKCQSGTTLSIANAKICNNISNRSAINTQDHSEYYHMTITNSTISNGASDGTASGSESDYDGVAILWSGTGKLTLNGSTQVTAGPNAGHGVVIYDGGNMEVSGSAGIFCMNVGSNYPSCILVRNKKPAGTTVYFNSTGKTYTVGDCIVKTDSEVEIRVSLIAGHSFKVRRCGRTGTINMIYNGKKWYMAGSAIPSAEEKPKLTYLLASGNSILDKSTEYSKDNWYVKTSVTEAFGSN